MKDDTRLIHTKTERGPLNTVNPPIERGSTVLLPTRQALYGPGKAYGRMGLTVQRELEEAMCTLENAQHCRLTMNGLQASTLAIASVVEAGDHILLADSIYGPTQRFCQRRLEAMGVASTRFVGNDLEALSRLIQPNTKAIVIESPGSLTFDILDTPAIAEIAKAKGITTIFDNTWGAGVYHRPLDLGVDISFQALTKYPVGHSDALGGAVMTNDKGLAARIATCSEDWGIALGPDDAYLALRGLRTIHTRMKQHETNAYTLARWLAERPEVDTVLHPGLPSHPDHAFWKRDFTGANGLFAVTFHAMPDAQLDRFLEALNLFGMGFSWGGFESLIIPCDDQLDRLPDHAIQSRKGPLIRLHIGLEATDDLIADLEQAFATSG